MGYNPIIGGITMSRWDLQFNEKAVYFKNQATTAEAILVGKMLAKGYDTIYVAFDVIGRTCHQILSSKLRSELKRMYGPKVEVEIGYNYECTVKWQRLFEYKMAYEIIHGAGCDGCNENGCNGHGCIHATELDTNLKPVTVEIIPEEIAPGNYELVPHYMAEGKEIAIDGRHCRADHILCFKHCMHCENNVHINQFGTCQLRVAKDDPISIFKIDEQVQFVYDVEQFGKKTRAIVAKHNKRK